MLFFFFFNDTATTEIYTLSLHDALPICVVVGKIDRGLGREAKRIAVCLLPVDQMRQKGLHRLLVADEVVVNEIEMAAITRSEEHTSELQSHSDLVCRLLLEKKKKHTRPI